MCSGIVQILLSSLKSILYVSFPPMIIAIDVSELIPIDELILLLISYNDLSCLRVLVEKS